MTIRFDEHDPSSPLSSSTEKNNSENSRASDSQLDYSPLPRLTMRSLAMGVPVSMGGMVNVRSGLIVALLSIGTLIGALLAAPIANRIGRRPSISIAALVVSVGFVIQISADTAWYQVMIGRFVAGFGVGLFITMGIFLAATFNYGTATHHPDSSASWRIVIGLGWPWTAVLGVGILFFPETPRYDFRNGNAERAKETLCRVYGASTRHWAVHTQIEEIERKLRGEQQTKSSSSLDEFVGMFKAPRMAYRVALGVALQMFQQLTGANYFYYGTTIFNSVQIDSFITQIILNTINFAVTFIGLYMVEHFGRRKSLIAGAIWMFICFLIFASVGHFMLDLQDPAKTPTPGIVLIVFACLFILGFATTRPRSFPRDTAPRAWLCRRPATGSGTFAWASSHPSSPRPSTSGMATSVFAARNLVAALIIYFFVIEGQGRTLEEIDTMYLEHVTPWKSTEWVAPPPEHMAEIRRQAGVDFDAAAEHDIDRVSISNGNGETQGSDQAIDKELEHFAPSHQEHV